MNGNEKLIIEGKSFQKPVARTPPTTQAGCLCYIGCPDLTERIPWERRAPARPEQEKDSGKIMFRTTSRQHHLKHA